MNTMPPPLPGTAQPRKSLLSPMVLSALVYPGAGQLMQRRWLAGVFYMVVSTVVMVWLVIAVFAVLKVYYGMAFEPMNVPVEAPGIAPLIIPFVVWVAIYVAGLIDTAIASYRQRVKSLPHPRF